VKTTQSGFCLSDDWPCMKTSTVSQITNIRFWNYRQILLQVMMNEKYLSDATRAAV
jgi:hypothetical protein